MRQALTPDGGCQPPPTGPTSSSARKGAATRALIFFFFRPLCGGEPPTAFETFAQCGTRALESPPPPRRQRRPDEMNVVGPEGAGTVAVDLFLRRSSVLFSSARFFFSATWPEGPRNFSLRREIMADATTAAAGLSGQNWLLFGRRRSKAGQGREYNQNLSL